MERPVSMNSHDHVLRPSHSQLLHHSKCIDWLQFLIKTGVKRLLIASYKSFLFAPSAAKWLTLRKRSCGDCDALTIHHTVTGQHWGSSRIFPQQRCSPEFEGLPFALDTRSPKGITTNKCLKSPGYRQRAGFSFSDWALCSDLA